MAANKMLILALFATVFVTVYARNCAKGKNLGPGEKVCRAEPNCEGVKVINGQNCCCQCSKNNATSGYYYPCGVTTAPTTKAPATTTAGAATTTAGAATTTAAGATTAAGTTAAGATTAAGTTAAGATTAAGTTAAGATTAAAST